MYRTITATKAITFFFIFVLSFSALRVVQRSSPPLGDKMIYLSFLENVIGQLSHKFDAFTHRQGERTKLLLFQALYQSAYCTAGRPPTACGVAPSIMVKGRKCRPAHVDEPHIGNVVIVKATASVCFADSVFAFIGIYTTNH